MADLLDAIGWQPPIVEAYGTVTLPEGMTQEEADRLVREADEQQECE